MSQALFLQGPKSADPLFTPTLVLRLLATGSCSFDMGAGQKQAIIVNRSAYLLSRHVYDMSIWYRVDQQTLHKALCTVLLYSHLRPPHEPELEDVVVASALDDLVAGVVRHVVVLVRLEQVLRGHRVALVQDALPKKRKQ